MFHRRSNPLLKLLHSRILFQQCPDFFFPSLLRLRPVISIYNINVFKINAFFFFFLKQASTKYIQTALCLLGEVGTEPWTAR